MPSAVYQYILTGYGAERFAVDQHGNLYLADMLENEGTSTNNYVLNVMAVSFLDFLVILTDF